MNTGVLKEILQKKCAGANQCYYCDIQLRWRHANSVIYRHITLFGDILATVTFSFIPL